MKFLKKPLTTIFFVFLIAAACKKTEIKDPYGPLPDMEATTAEVYADGGLTLSGNINKVPDVAKHYGFILSKDSLFKSLPQVFVPVTSPIQTGAFEADVNTGITKGLKYFFTVYWADEKLSPTIFNTISFIATGSKKIKFESILPLKAHLGDTLTIKGKYFSGQTFGSILFDDKVSAYNIKVINDSLATCIIPTTNITRINPIITFKNASQTELLTDKFVLHTPEIHNFTPVSTFNDTIVINGNHFSNFVNGNEVKFGNIKAKVVSNGRKQLKALVPENIENSVTKISVTAQIQSVLSNTTFQIKPHLLTSSPTSGFIGNSITIEGKYFNPDYNRNEIFMGDNAIRATSGNSTKLTFSVPNGIYPHKTTTISVKVLDHTANYPVKFSIENKWVAVDYKMPFNTYSASGAFTINDVSYVVAPEKGSSNPEYLWKFNPSNYNWQKMNDLPVAFMSGIVTATNTKAYLYVQTDRNTAPIKDNFWEYNPATDSWTKKERFPYGLQYKTFAIGNKVYLGLSNEDNSFYQFDIMTSKWSKIAAYPDHSASYIASFPPSFVINDVAYLGGLNSGNFYSYSPNTNTWKNIKTPPAMGTSYFSYNGYGFMIGNETSYNRYVRYDPTSDNWYSSPDLVLTPTSMTRGVTFINNGNVYICTGASLYYTLTTPAGGL